MTIIRVGSLNTGLTDWAVDLKRWRERASQLSGLIRELSLDVVLLQEIWRIKWEEADDKLKTFMTGLGLPGDYNKDEILAETLGGEFSVKSSLIQSYDRGQQQSGLYWGLALLSRFPIEKVQHQSLSYSKFDRWPRIAQSGTIKVSDDIHSTFVNVHLPAESNEARLRTGLETLQFAVSRAAPAACIGGDLNSGPQAGPAHIFLSRYSDCWSQASTRIVRFETKDARHGSGLFRTVDEGRIDYIFAERLAGITNSIYLYGDYGDAPLSDHPFVVSHIDLAGNLARH